MGSFRNALALLSLAMLSGGALAAECPALLDRQKRPLAEDHPVNLCDVMYGKVVLVVNTASKCAYTPQYEGLEALYDRYRSRGLVVAGFPSADFAGQEFAGEQRIKEFCRLTYSVAFPMFEKTRVVGPGTDAFYTALREASGEAPRWNFHKYLLDREGRVVGSFASHVTPSDSALLEQIEELL